MSDVGAGLSAAFADIASLFRERYQSQQAMEFRRQMAKEERDARREDLKYESGIRPPQIATREETDAHGNRFAVDSQWVPDFERGTGQFKEIGRRQIQARPKSTFEAKVGDEIRTMERMDDGSVRPLMLDGKAASAPRYRAQQPSSGKPSYESWQMEDGTYRYLEKGGEIPPGARPARSGKQTAGLTAREAASFLQTIAKNKPYDSDARTYAREQLGLDYDELLAKVNGAKGKKSGGRSPLMSVVDTVTGAMGKLREKAAQGGAPKPGEVQDGYRFKGGDPSDPANWEKI